MAAVYAARYDPGGLWPQDAGARALADRWMDWQQTVLFPPWVAVFFGVWRTIATRRPMPAPSPA